MTYEWLAQFAQTWGLWYVIAIFACVVIYACWPGNKETFDRAAQMPLDEDLP